jgi:hypothetical protein
MFSDHPTADGKSTGRGFGWLVSQSKEGVVARLAGSVWTGSSAVLFLPDKRFAAVVSTNLGFQQPGPCSIRLPLRGGTGSSEGRKDEGRQHPLPAFRFHPADH